MPKVRYKMQSDMMHRSVIISRGKLYKFSVNLKKVSEKANIKPESLAQVVPERMIRTRQRLNLPLDIVIKACKKYPPLYLALPETIEAKCRDAAKALGVTFQEYAELAVKHPRLFGSNTNTILTNIEATAKLLGISEKQFIQVCVKYPALFTQMPETINANTEDTSLLLGITRSDFIKMALKRGSLFSSDPKTILSKVDPAAKILGLTTQQFMVLAFKHPQLLDTSTHTLQENFKTLLLLFPSEEKAIKFVFTTPSILNISEERNFTHYIVRKITGKFTHPNKKPTTLLKAMMADRPDYPLDKLLRILEHFTAYSMAKRIREKAELAGPNMPAMRLDQA